MNSVKDICNSCIMCMSIMLLFGDATTSSSTFLNGQLWNGNSYPTNKKKVGCVLFKIGHFPTILSTNKSLFTGMKLKIFAWRSQLLFL